MWRSGKESYTDDSWSITNTRKDPYNDAAIFLTLHWEFIQCYTDPGLLTEHIGKMVDYLANKYGIHEVNIIITGE